MRVNILTYARARQIIGKPEIALDLPESATVADLRSALAKVYPAIAPLLANILVAVDQEFTVDSHPIFESSEIALIPPVSGGHDD